MAELINSESETTIGIMEVKDKDDAEVYVPLICWNLAILSYVSDPDSSYRAYGCDVKIQSLADGSVRTFRVYIKENDFTSLKRLELQLLPRPMES